MSVKVGERLRCVKSTSTVELVKGLGGFCWELNPRRGANSTTLLGSPSPPTKDPSVKSMGLLLGCIHGAELNLIMVWLKPWIDRESLKHRLS